MRFGRDITVIILGVLIALAFDSWVASRADRRLERSYLVRLARDLRADSALLEEYQRNAARGEAGGQRLLSLLINRSEAAPDTMIARCFSDATRGALSTANMPTILELTGTGNLRVLRNVELRDAVLTYYAEVERLQRTIETVMRRGREPLAELGWDIRAFDPTLSYAVMRTAPNTTVDTASAGGISGQALIHRFREHPDAERATHRAVTYQRFLRPIMTDWARQLQIVRARMEVAQ